MTDTALTKKETVSTKARMRQAEQIARLYAFAKRGGVENPEEATLEELIQGYQRAWVELHGKNIDQALAATKARDMESFNRVYIPPEETKKPDAPPDKPAPIMIEAETLMELVTLVERHTAAARDQARAVDGIEAPNPKRGEQ